MERQQIEFGALPQVRAIVGISRSEIHRRVAAKTFPAPVRLGSRCTRWNLAEVRAWAAARLAERDAQLQQREARRMQTVRHGAARDARVV